MSYWTGTDPQIQEVNTHHHPNGIINANEIHTRKESRNNYTFGQFMNWWKQLYVWIIVSDIFERNQYKLETVVIITQWSLQLVTKIGAIVCIDSEFGKFPKYFISNHRLELLYQNNSQIHVIWQIRNGKKNDKTYETASMTTAFVNEQRVKSLNRGTLNTIERLFSDPIRRLEKISKMK